MAAELIKGRKSIQSHTLMIEYIDLHLTTLCSRGSFGLVFLLKAASYYAPSMRGVFFPLSDINKACPIF